MWTHGQPAGDYIFRPFAGEFVPLTYSKLQNATISNGKTMDFYFHDLQDHTNNVKFEKAIVHVSIDKDYAVLRFDVDLNSLPGGDLDGYDVIVDF